MTTQRRTFLKQSAAITAATAVAGFPAIAQSQSGPIKVGILHPVTGFLAYSGNLCRVGAKLAVEEINATGGIKSLGGAKLAVRWRRDIGRRPDGSRPR